MTKQWEYKVERWLIDPMATADTVWTDGAVRLTESMLADEMNRLGADGWDCFKIFECGPQARRMAYHFKREVQPVDKHQDTSAHKEVKTRFITNDEFDAKLAEFSKKMFARLHVDDQTFWPIPLKDRDPYRFSMIDITTGLHTANGTPVNAVRVREGSVEATVDGGASWFQVSPLRRRDDPPIAP